jgi:hypothetical protein
MMDLMGKQNICTGFLESGQSEFRERSKIINIELVHGCVRGDGVMCHYGRVCVCFATLWPLNCSDGYAVCSRKAGLCCAEL